MESWNHHGYFFFFLFQLNNDIESYSLTLVLLCNSLFGCYKVLSAVYRLLAMGLKELRAVGILHATSGSCELEREYM